MATNQTLGMRALYYIALMRDTDNMDNSNDPNGTDSQRIQWLKSNQNRLNQNFTLISNQLDDILSRLDSIEARNG